MTKKKQWWTGMKAGDISIHLYEAVRARHTAPEWATFGELRGGTSYGGNREKVIDVVTVHLWQAGTQQVVAYEIKASRADFMNEINYPKKRQYAESISTSAYFATPVGLVEKSEVPEPWGLIEIQRGGRCATKRVATQRKIEPWPWHQIQALARRVADQDKCGEAGHTPHWKLLGVNLTREDLEKHLSELQKTAEVRAYRKGKDEAILAFKATREYTKLRTLHDAVVKVCGPQIYHNPAGEFKNWVEEQKKEMPDALRNRLMITRGAINNILEKEKTKGLLKVMDAKPKKGTTLLFDGEELYAGSKCQACGCTCGERVASTVTICPNCGACDWLPIPKTKKEE